MTEAASSVSRLTTTAAVAAKLPSSASTAGWPSTGSQAIDATAPPNQAVGSCGTPTVCPKWLPRPACTRAVCSSVAAASPSSTGGTRACSRAAPQVTATAHPLTAAAPASTGMPGASAAPKPWPSAGGRALVIRSNPMPLDRPVRTGYGVYLTTPPTRSRPNSAVSTPPAAMPSATSTSTGQAAASPARPALARCGSSAVTSAPVSSARAAPASPTRRPAPASDAVALPMAAPSRASPIATGPKAAPSGASAISP